MVEKSIGNEVLIMAQTKEEKQASNRAAVKNFYKEKCVEFKVRPRKEEGEEIKKYAAEHGLSVQKLFLEAVRAYMGGGAKEEASPYCVDLGEDIGKKATVSAKRYNATITDYVRIVLKERFKQEIQLVLQQIKAERENKEETSEQVNK